MGGLAITSATPAMAGVATPAGGAMSAPAAAQAAPPPAVVEADTAMAAGEFYDDYWSRNDCINTGQWLVRTGQYRHFVCEEDWLDWNLYVYA